MAHVLVVDDDSSVVRLVSWILKSEGFEVQAAQSGEQGVALLAEGPDLVLMDLRMPEMDGRTFYQRARQVGYGGPVVVCSAYGAANAQRELGAQGAIDKPFDPEELLNLVNGLLQRRQT